MHIISVLCHIETIKIYNFYSDKSFGLEVMRFQKLFNYDYLSERNK